MGIAPENSFPVICTPPPMEYLGQNPGCGTWCERMRVRDVIPYAYKLGPVLDGQGGQWIFAMISRPP